MIIISLLIGSVSSYAQMNGGSGRPPMDGKAPAALKGKGGPEIKNNGSKNNKKNINEYIDEFKKTDGQVYIFGFSQSFGDTISYITDVNLIDSLSIEKKTKFLPFRYEFSIQLKEYLEGKLGLKLQTTSIFYGKNKSKMEKKLAKLKKRYLNMEHSTIVPVKEDDFHFVHPLDKMREFSSGAFTSDQK
ncbi:MAG: hypothetical protein K6E54_01770 [Bacteroidaceae bacterium]|nr:hypothetical protein [Bacteroidaceae bacterium]